MYKAKIKLLRDGWSWVLTHTVVEDINFLGKEEHALVFDSFHGAVNAVSDIVDFVEVMGEKVLEVDIYDAF